MRSALLLLVLSSALVFSSGEPCNALAPEYQAAFQASALELYYQRPVYKLGGTLETRSVDCSYFIWMCFKRGGVPIGSSRPQAWVIYRGGGGFVGRSIEWMRDDFQSEVADLLCLRVPGSLNRPFGINHVGGTLLYRGVFQVIDANSRSKGIRIMPFQGIWRKYLPKDGYKRLTIGD